MDSMEILIADDHELFRRGLRSFLESRPDWHVCGEAADGKEAVAKAKELKPDVVLLDVSMPKMNGLDAARVIRREMPSSNILIVSQNDANLMEKAALQAGAKRYIQKTRISPDLTEALEALSLEALNNEARSNDRKVPTETGGEESAIAAQRHLDAEEAEPAAQSREQQFRSMIDAIPVASSLLAAIVDSSDDAIISKNFDGIITSWNKSAERMFGYTADEAIGKPITLLIPLGCRGEEEEIIARLKRGERVDHFETTRVRKDGSTLDVSLTISPVRDATGRPVGASKVARDITQRKRTDKALADAARQQKALFHLADELHRAWSLEDVYNAGLEAICGALECDRAAILLHDDHGVMRFVSWRGLSESYRSAVEGHSPWRTEETNPQPICIDNIDAAAFEDALKATVKVVGIHALAFVPLVSEGKLMGKFMVYFPARHEFSKDDIELSLAIARQLAFAIDRKRADAALREGKEQFRKLSESLDAEVRMRTDELVSRNTGMLKQSEQLRDLSQRLLQAQDEERRHIARELHDSAGQTLTVLEMNLAHLLREAQQNAPSLARDAEETLRLLQQLTREIRTTSYLLHPPLLDESGLASALSWYIEGLRDRSGLDIMLAIPEEFGRLPRAIELVVFRLVQECVTNIHRHSGSKSASIEIAREGESVSIEVADKGRGMSREKLAEIQSHGSGVGIRGMQERVRQFHGNMQIESNSSGTRILVTIPVPADTQQGELIIGPLQTA